MGLDLKTTKREKNLGKIQKLSFLMKTQCQSHESRKQLTSKIILAFKGVVTTSMEAFDNGIN